LIAAALQENTVRPHPSLTRGRICACS
jgi:hypothetical protein